METVSEQSFKDAVDAILKTRNSDYAESMANVAMVWIKEYESGLPRLTDKQYTILKEIV
ncbi:hypothetical protein [Pectobacterium polaris]|uniref:hypothetical protein n=1 Tax=Pectobacterium polaris TaxID=2042057 RepID=UPI0032E4841F